jgi:hypothetical protein
MSAPSFSVRALAERVIAESNTPPYLPTNLPTGAVQSGESVPEKWGSSPAPPKRLFPCVSCGATASDEALFCPSCWQAREARRKGAA